MVYNFYEAERLVGTLRNATGEEVDRDRYREGRKPRGTSGWC